MPPSSWVSVCRIGNYPSAEIEKKMTKIVIVNVTDMLDIKKPTAGNFMLDMLINLISEIKITCISTTVMVARYESCQFIHNSDCYTATQHPAN